MQPSAPPSIVPPSQEPLVNYLRRYLGIINEIPRKEKRFAILKDLMAVTPNSQSLHYRLAILESKGYILRFEDGREIRFLKTDNGKRLEQMINEDWEHIVHLNEYWQGQEMRRHY
jgi:hypothetical protein